MPDYEDMILARQEAWEAVGDCDSDCEHCVHSEWCEYAQEDEVIDFCEIKRCGYEDE